MMPSHIFAEEHVQNIDMRRLKKFATNSHVLFTQFTFSYRFLNLKMTLTSRVYLPSLNRTNHTDVVALAISGQD